MSAQRGKRLPFKETCGATGTIAPSAVSPQSSTEVELEMKGTI
jgi:hypothetical protein